MMDIKRLQAGYVWLKMPFPIMLWVEASFCPRSLCGRDDRGLDCRDTCVLLPRKTKRWNKAKQTITKLLLWQLCGSAETLCLKVTRQKLPLRFRHEITRVNKHGSVRALSVYSFPLWDEKRKPRRTKKWLLVVVAVNAAFSQQGGRLTSVALDVIQCTKLTRFSLACYTNYPKKQKHTYYNQTISILEKHVSC